MAKKNKNDTQPKLKEIQSVQSFSPIREIRDGVICTKDGRFVKLMEFSPINFNLRAADEQTAIINQFAAALRTMPPTLQLKVVSRKADTDKLLTALNSHYEQEPNMRCRRLQMEQMEMISTVGQEQGVSRRFFMAFEYEAQGGLKKKPSFSQIASSIRRTAFGIRASMENCGNDCLTPERGEAADKWTRDALYSIMCRTLSEKEPYDVHEFLKVSQYASEYAQYNESTYGLPVNDLICPMSIDDKVSPNYIIVNAGNGAPPLYYMFCYLPGGCYPRSCIGGWLNVLINMGDGVDVDIYIHREHAENISRALTYLLRSKNIKAKNSDDTSTDYDELMDAIGSGYYVKQGIASNEDFYYFACMLTITAHSLDELTFRFEEIKKFLTKQELELRRCSFQMLDAFKMSLPLAKYNPGIFNKSRRNILGSQLASLYPFVSYEMTDEDGVLLGIQENGSLVLLDNFDTHKYSNANICIMGSTGAGKTYLLQTMALRFREKQTQVFVIAPDKGHEFQRGCEAIGGQFITISPGSGQNINIMEIRKKDERNTKLIDGESLAAGSILSGKIQSLHAFFSLLIPDISYEEKQQLDEGLMKTYQKFGITTKNDSLDDPLRPGHYRPMPILGDLHKTLKELGPAAQRLHNILGRYVNGSAASFNQPTNVNLDNQYVVLDVSKLTKEMLPIGMFIALDYVWDKAREDRTAKKVVMMDEGWKMIGPTASPEAAEFALEVFKVIRGYGGSAVFATQDLNDFLALRDGQFGKAIINNSKTKVVMKVEKTEAERLAEALDLTRMETEKIISMQRGHGLLVANSNHVFIEVQACQTEHDLITTDRQDLENIAARNAGAQI